MDIAIYITSDLTSSERRISPQWTIGYLKQRLEQITGVEAQSMGLQHYPVGNSSEYIEIGESNEKAIADLSVAPYSRIHVVDTNPDSNLKQLDEETVSGFTLSEEDYSNRSDSVLQWKKQQKLGRFDPNYNSRKAQAQAENEKSAESIRVGSRARVFNIEGERRGVVRFVGRIDALDDGENVWVGMEFDEPVGKNDGSIGAVRIFNARAKHGSFVRPKQVEVGDYPELDPFASDEEEL